MKRIIFTSLFFLGLMVAYAGQREKELSGAFRSSTYRGFAENRGQLKDMAGRPVPFVLYSATGDGMDVYITEKGITYVFRKSARQGVTQVGGSASGGKHESEEMEEEEEMLQRYETVEMKLEGAQILRSNILAEGASENYSNHYQAHCPAGVLGVRSYSRLVVSDIYPGIDWVIYHKTGTGFKYDYIVHPGADPTKIAMLYRSLKPLMLNSDGSVGITTQLGGTLKEDAPVAYTESGTAVKCDFSVSRHAKEKSVYRATVRFSAEKWPAGETLVIDPQLSWCTIYGGVSTDGITSTDLDTKGNIFLVGYTPSNDFPVLNANTFFQGSFTSQTSFILKFSSQGALLWATFYGTLTIPPGFYGVCTDLNDNIFIAGSSNAVNFPVQNAGTFFQGTVGGNTDAVILKFDNFGNRLWATYYGGSNNDFSYTVDTDVNNNVFVVGATTSTNFPTQNAGTFYQASITNTLSNAFILKFDNLGNRLWATYHGDGNVPAYCVRVDLSGNVYMAGTAAGSSATPSLQVQNPGGGAWFQPTFGGVNDAYIVKFTNTGVRLWSTYYGGTGSDQPFSIVTDVQNNLYLMGNTSSANFPVLTSGNFFQGALGTGPDAYLVKFNSAGVRQWATLLGGNGSETAGTYDGLAVDSCDRIYLAFETRSSNMPIIAACEGGYLDGTLDMTNTMLYADMYLGRMTGSGILEWGTYFGGDGREFRAPIEVDTSGRLILAGEFTFVSNIATYPLTNPGLPAYYDNTFHGSDDSMISAFVNSSQASVGSFSYMPMICKGSASALSPSLAPGFSTGGTFTSSPGLQLNNVNGIINVTNSSPGSYTVIYNFQSCGCRPALQFSAGLTISPTVSVAVVSQSFCSGGSATLLATSANTGVITYSWLPAGSGNSLVVSPSSNSQYTVHATSVDGCTAQAIAQVSVLPLPQLTVTSTPSLCIGGLAILNVTGYQGPGSLTWSPGGYVAQSITIAPVATAIYTVAVVDVNGCTSSATTTVQVIPLPQVSVTPSFSLCQGSTATLTASGANTYSWSNGIAVASQTVKPTNTSIYTVMGNMDGCQAGASVTVTVVKCNTVTGVAELSQAVAHVQVFPNPSGEYFFVASDVPVQLQLFDAAGRLVRIIDLDARTGLQTRVEGLAEGTYILTGEKGREVVRVVVRR